MVSFPLTLSLSNTAGTKYANVGPHIKQKLIFMSVVCQRWETLKGDTLRHTEKKKVRAENNESRVTAVRQEKSEVGTRFDQRRVMI